MSTTGFGLGGPPPRASLCEPKQELGRCCVCSCSRSSGVFLSLLFRRSPKRIPEVPDGILALPAGRFSLGRCYAGILGENFLPHKCCFFGG